jgi:hypothetical protein
MGQQARVNRKRGLAFTVALDPRNTRLWNNHFSCCKVMRANAALPFAANCLWCRLPCLHNDEPTAVAFWTLHQKSNSGCVA